MFYKVLPLLFFVFFVAAASSAAAQKSSSPSNKLIPSSSRVALFSEVLYSPNEPFSDAFRELRLNTDFFYPKGISFHTVSELALANRKLQNQPQLRLAQAYIRWQKSTKKDSSVIAYSSSLKVGHLQWFPPINQALVLAENINRFTQPLIFAGVDENFTLFVGKKRNLMIEVDVLVGDTLGTNSNLVFDFYNAFVRYKKVIYKNIVFNTQIGKALGYKHLVNYAYVSWRPKSEELQFDIQVGKLAGYEQSPFGASFGIERVFNAVAIGAFYQRRINQAEEKQIAGFTLQFLKPKWLATLTNTYSLYIDFSNRTVFMNIPLLTVELNK